jgi:hypothetical protein
MPLCCAKISEPAVYPIVILLLHRPADLGITGGASLQPAAPAA